MAAIRAVSGNLSRHVAEFARIQNFSPFKILANSATTATTMKSGHTRGANLIDPDRSGMQNALSAQLESIMQRSRNMPCLGTLTLVAGTVLAGAATPVSEQEAAQWLRWVVPLPKKARIASQVVLPVQGVTVRVAGAAGPVKRHAAGELREILQQKEHAPATAGVFEIVLDTCDAQGRLDGQAVPGADALAGCPNKEQAYVIAPLGDNRIALVGLDPRGVYYAAKTFGQLVAPTLRDGEVTIPLAEVIDWPDLEERGIWWFKANFSDQELDWYAGVKLNHMEILATLSVKEDKPATGTIDAEAVARCRLRAIKMMPAVVHLEQLQSTGLFDAFPETSAKGEPEHWKRYGGVHPICFSQPTTQRVFDEWFTSLAQTVDSDDLMAWFSENTVHCICEDCKKTGQFENEMRIMLHAWRAAQKVKPALRLRMLLSQATHRQNIALIEAAPPEVGITYYHGGLTYTVARQPMIYPELRQAVQGRRFGCYPTLCAAYYAPGPFAAAGYMKERMSEFKDAGVRCLAGFAPPTFRVNDICLSAAAEFAWNASGRTPREFMLAWATRHYLPDPEKVAEWWELIEEPQRDVYISRAVSDRFGRELGRLLDARQPAALGSGFLAGFPEQGGLEADIERARQALPIAKSISHERFTHATEYTLGILEAVQGARDLTMRLADRKTLTEADKKDATVLFEQTYAGLARSIEALPAWNNCVRLYPGQKPRTAGMRALLYLEDAQRMLVRYARELGLDAPFIWYARQQIDSWQTGTFPVDGKRVDHRIDVTEFVKRAGTYVVTFDYTKGHEALQMQRVALMAQVGGGPDQEVAVDAHTGRTGAWDENSQYTLRLKHYDPKARYMLVAQVNVTTTARDIKARTTQGDIYIQCLPESKPP